MARIRGRGNRATELRLIALMREHGITGWQRNAKVFGKPELRKAGWRVWECALTRSRARATLARIDRALGAGG